jgi:hypothetical protein
MFTDKKILRKRQKCVKVREHIKYLDNFVCLCLPYRAGTTKEESSQIAQYL